MVEPIRSRAGVCDVEYLRGPAADPSAAPDLLLEVAHGATRARDFTELRAQLQGHYADDLIEFFFVNTDVGAPELARAVAQRVVRSQPRRTAMVVRCLVPRTFVDCNRRIDRAALPAASKAGEMTPGMPPWVQHPADQQLLLDRYFAYRDVVTAAFEQTMQNGGLSLFVHTYAPRSIDVAVDAGIVASLRAAYAADRIGTWALRPAVDLITHDPDGKELASPRLAMRAAAEFAAAGFEVARNATYPLHPVTLAHAFAAARPTSTLCLEVRRDLLLPEFVPFRELLPDPAKVERAAAPLAAAVLSGLT
jgi:predicted N-formylglutamate amidohydrolase